MKTRALLAAAALFTTVSVANAGEPVTLTEAEMDNVSAGLIGFALAEAYANASATGVLLAYAGSETYANTVSGLLYAYAEAGSSSIANSN